MNKNNINVLDNVTFTAEYLSKEQWVSNSMRLNLNWNSNKCLNWIINNSNFKISSIILNIYEKN